MPHVRSSPRALRWSLCLEGSSLSSSYAWLLLVIEVSAYIEHLLPPVSSSHAVITTLPSSNSLHSPLPMTFPVCPGQVYTYCQVWLLIETCWLSNVGNRFYGHLIYKNLIFVWLLSISSYKDVWSLAYILCASELSSDYFSNCIHSAWHWKVLRKEGRKERRNTVRV